MNLKKLVPILTVSALMLAGLVGFTSINKASAAGATPTPAASTTTDATTPTTPVTPGDMGRGGRGDRGGGYTHDELASALGITTDELTAAYTQANTDAVTQAVADGLITQAQADAMNSKGSAFPFGGHMDGFLGKNGIDFQTYLAKALNISVDDLKAAQTKALDAHLAALVSAGTMTQDQADMTKGQQALFSNDTFKSTMQTAFESAVKQAVTSGLITQSQADLILSNVANNRSSGTGWGFDGGFGMGGGHRGR